MPMPICCAGDLSLGFMKGLLRDSRYYVGRERWDRTGGAEFVDSLSQDAIQALSERIASALLVTSASPVGLHPATDVVPASSPDCPFKGRTVEECWELLQKKQNHTRSSTGGSSFIVADDRSTKDFTVLACQAVKQRGQEFVVVSENASDNCDSHSGQTAEQGEGMEDEEEVFAVRSVRTYYSAAYKTLLEYNIEEVLAGDYGPNLLDDNDVLDDMTLYNRVPVSTRLKALSLTDEAQEQTESVSSS